MGEIEGSVVVFPLDLEFCGVLVAASSFSIGSSSASLGLFRSGDVALPGREFGLGAQLPGDHHDCLLARDSQWYPGEHDQQLRDEVYVVVEIEIHSPPGD